MNSYIDFAYIYDRLMHKDVNYEKWADYIEKIFTMYDVNEDLMFYQPSYTNVFVDAMCIPKTSSNKTVAERYINFMLSKEPAIANAEYIYGSAINLSNQPSKRLLKLFVNAVFWFKIISV